MTNATLYQALNELLNDRFSNKMSVLEQHSVDESWHKGRAPQGVCYPKCLSAALGALGELRPRQVPSSPALWSILISFVA